MIRAFVLSFLGAYFEVRLINTKSGKDIPGTRLCRGGYWKCRKVCRNKTLKTNEVLRLQAVTQLDWRFQASETLIEIPPEMMINVDEGATVVPDKIWHNSDLNDLKKRVDGEFRDFQEEFASPSDIGDSNARQSEFMAEHQDEPNAYRGEDLDDHLCDLDGPQDWNMDTSIYEPTCSICGSMG